MQTIEQLKLNLDSVKAQMSALGAHDVQIVAASKTQSSQTVDMLHSIDKDIIFGENRVQELCAKYNPDYRWHFIGQLQSNKVKKIIDKVDLIHSLDRLNLAEEIERQASAREKTVSVLIEINIGGELSKGGIQGAELGEFAKRLTDFEHIKVEGLMSVAPLDVSGEKLEDCFKTLQELYFSLKNFDAPNFDVVTLSAGMSSDYTVALRHGANMIRLGSILFGQRNYSI